MHPTAAATIRELENMAIRAQIFELAVLIVAFIITMWATYHVIKAAIRDGINESNIGRRGTWAETASRAATDLPDMRAER